MSDTVTVQVKDALGFTAQATFIIPPRAATPAFSPAAGTYTSIQAVTLSCATPGATIYFTTDGSTPTTASAVYASPLSVGVSETINALATATGFAPSLVGSAPYVINLPLAATPTFSPVAGTYAGAQTVSLSTATGGATIYYTTNGFTPTTSSAVYSAPILVGASETLKAIAVASGFANSAVGTAAYVISGAPAAAGVTFKFIPGYILESINVDDVRKTGGTNDQAELALIAPGAATAGAAGYSPNYTVPSLTRGANGTGSVQGDYSKFSDLTTDFNNSQAALPGCLFAPCFQSDVNVNWTNYTGGGAAHQFSGGSGPVPGYILTCGGAVNVNNKYDGSTGTTAFTLPVQANGQCGFAYSNWTGTQYIVAATALHEAAIEKDLENFFTFALSVFTLPWPIASGGDGKNYTLDKHPLVPFIRLGNEVSYTFGASGAPANYSGTGAHQLTVNNYWAAYYKYANAIAAIAPRTPIKHNVTSGVQGGTDGSSDTASSFNTANGYLSPAVASLGGIPGLPFISGTVLCPSDTYGSHFTSHFNSNLGPQAQNSVQAHFGIQTASGGSGSVAMPTPTNPSMNGQWAVSSQWQTPDYNGSTSATSHRFYFTATQTATQIANTTVAVQQLLQAALQAPPPGAGLPAAFNKGLNASWIVLTPCSQFAPGGGAGFNLADYGNYIWPTVKAAALLPYSQRPKNLMTGVTINAVTVASPTSLTITWTPFPLNPAETGLTYTLFRNGIAVATGFTSGTITDTGLTAGTPYTYTMAVVNANGVGPQGPPVVGQIAGQVFNYPNFTSTANLNTAASATFTSPYVALLPGSGHKAGAVWYTTQVKVSGGFTTNFTFNMGGAYPAVPANPVTIAGITFCVQNTTAALNPPAFGIHASSDANCCGLGAFSQVPQTSQFPLINSVAVKFDANNISLTNFPAGGAPNSTGLYINGGPLGGLLPQNDLNPYGISFYSGHTMAGTAIYDGSSLLTVVLTDTVTGVSCRQVYPVNIQNSCSSDLNWFGFTCGATNVPGAINLINWSLSTGFNTQLAAPTFSVTPGQYASTQSVSLSGPSGASIWYTKNGLLPSSGGVGSALYTGPISVTANTVIQMVAQQPGFTDSPVVMGSYQIATANVINFPSGFSSASPIILTGRAILNGTALQLVDGGAPSTGAEMGAAWYPAPVPVTSFTTNFQVQFNSANGNGFTFCLQNPIAPYSSANQAPAWSGGANAMSYAASEMGYGGNENSAGPVQSAGILSSIALAFDFFHVPNSVGLYTNGATPQGSQIATGLTFSGHTFTVTLAYSGTTLAMTMTDTSTHASFTHNFTGINIPTTVGGNTAIAGFTCGTGGATVIPLIQNWTM